MDSSFVERSGADGLRSENEARDRQDDRLAARFARIDEKQLLERLRRRLPPAFFVVDEKTPVDWTEIEKRCEKWVEPMKTTLQNRDRHAEGDVWTHSKMTVDALRALPAWREKSEVRRLALFLAALWHDVGKPVCTKIKKGRIISPNHSARGAAIVRRLLAERCGLDDGAESDVLDFREEVVRLIEYHTKPHFFLENRNKHWEIELISRLVSNETLAILSEADVRGRRGGSLEERLKKIDFFREFAKKNDCWTPRN